MSFIQQKYFWPYRTAVTTINLQHDYYHLMHELTKDFSWRSFQLLACFFCNFFKPIAMKRIYFLAVPVIFSLAACNSTETTETESMSDSTMPDPAAVQPPEDAIPDSMRLANDSVILPDITSPQNRQPRSADSLQQVP